jgi:alpha-tubulin suppressor-like RCC1 family protein
MDTPISQLAKMTLVIYKWCRYCIKHKYRVNEESMRNWILSIVIGLGIIVAIGNSSTNKSYAVARDVTPIIDARQNSVRASSDIQKVAIGPSFAIGLLQNGNLMAWGDNRKWQTTIPHRYKDRIFTDVAAGVSTAYVLENTGTVYAWGDENLYGEGTIPVAAQSNVIAIAAGGRNAMALKSDGTVVVWGRNDFGQLNVPIPTPIYAAR